MIRSAIQPGPRPFDPCAGPRAHEIIVPGSCALPHLRGMTDADLARRLRTLYRTVRMLETELRHGHLDEDLVAAIDRRMEDGIGSEPRCSELRAAVDALRESLMTPRPELFGDAIRACTTLMDRIDAVLDLT